VRIHSGGIRWGGRCSQGICRAADRQRLRAQGIRSFFTNCVFYPVGKSAGTKLGGGNRIKVDKMGLTRRWERRCFDGDPRFNDRKHVPHTWEIPAGYLAVEYGLFCRTPIQGVLIDSVGGNILSRFYLAFRYKVAGGFIRAGVFLASIFVGRELSVWQVFRRF